MNNKKGQVEDWLPMILIIVVFIFIFLFFLFPDKSQQERKEIARFESFDLEAEKILIAFLRQDYENKDADISIADAIQLYISARDQKLLDGISLKAREFFSKTPLETDISTWSLEIQDEATNTAINKRGSKPTPVNIPSARKAIAEISVPNFENEPIKVRLFLDHQ